MRATILGFGTAVPDNRVTQDEAYRVAVALSADTPTQADWLGTLYRQTDIHARHMVHGVESLRETLEAARRDIAARSLGRQRNDDDSSTPVLDLRELRIAPPSPTTGERMAAYRRASAPLAEAAARAALHDASVASSEISHLVTASCTGFAAPGVDIALIKSLPLSPRIERTHVGFMGCHAAFNALRVAANFVRANPKAKVLVCTVELCSQHYQFTSRVEHIVANSLFADGAGAFVVAAGDAADSARWNLISNGSVIVPDSEDAMTWTIGDFGFEMTLSKAVPMLIETKIRPWLETWLRDCGLTLADVKSWAIHPGGPRIVLAAEAALGLSHSSSEIARSVLRDFGNMSSATIAFVLQRLRDAGAPRPCVALGFGPGLTAEAMLFA